MSWSFWSAVDVRGTDECWEWRGFKNSDGYGKTSWGGKHWYAHRLAYKLETGHDPEGVVMHTCDTPDCCNPGHLVDATQGDNAKDMVMKGRHAGKLTAKQVTGIRELLAEDHPQHHIAKLYGVSQSLISKIHTGRHWSCV